MRPDLTGAEQTLLESGEYDEHWRVKVANGDGTMIDVSSRLKSGTIRLPNPDATVGTADLTFLREPGNDASTSLAPLVEAGTDYNVLDDGVTYSPLFQIGRAATIEIAVTARGAARPADVSTSWHELLGGFVKTPSWPERFGDVSLQIQDRAYKLKRTFIEDPQLYLAETTIEDAIQALLDDVMGAGAYTVVVDGTGTPSTATGEALAQDYKPDIKPVWDACQDLAKSIGWVLWYRYDGSGNPQLTLTEPRRSKTTADYTFSLAQIREVTELTVIEEDIRNVVLIDYVDEQGDQQTVSDEDTTSIATYGGIRRYMRLVEDAGSPIQSSAAATSLLAAVLSDCANPDADQAIKTRGAWWPGEPSVDLYAFAANTYLYDSDQKFAPYGIEISFSVGQLSSAVVRARGKPSAGSGTWQGRGSGNGRTDMEKARAGELYNWRRLYDVPTAGQLTIKWDRGSEVEYVFVWANTLATPLTDDAGLTYPSKPYPDNTDDGAPTDALAVGTDEYVFDVPTDPDVTFVQFEARNADLKILNVYRMEIKPRSAFSVDDIPSNAIGFSKLKQAAQTFGSDISFSAADWDTVDWGAGSIWTGDGTTYSITAGSTGNLSASGMFWIYLDTAVSTTALQITNNVNNAVGDGKILVAGCRRSSLGSSGGMDAGVFPATGILGLNGDNINPDSVRTNHIQVNQLDGISANLGTVTAGTIDTLVLVAAESFTASNPVFDGEMKVYGGFAYSNFSVYDQGGGVIRAKLEDRDLTGYGGVYLEPYMGGGVKLYVRDFTAGPPSNDSGDVLALQLATTDTGGAPMIGLFGATPVAQPSAYTPTNVTTDRTYDANATTVAELADVLGTLIADLQGLGAIG